MNYVFKPKQLNWKEDTSFFIDSETIDIQLYEDGIKIDLSLFKHVKNLGCDLKNVVNFEKLPMLKTLGLGGYKDGLNYVKNQTHLEALNLFQNQISFLEPLNDLSMLKNLNLYLNNRLHEISGIKNHPCLKELDIESCKKIPVDHLIDVVTSCKNLEVLKLSHFEFSNLEWVKEMKSLKQLVIIDCNVLNGDIRPAAQLEYIAFNNRNHYNYRFDSGTRTIHPVIPKGIFEAKDQNERNDKHKKSLVEIPHFGVLDIKSLKMDYETDMPFNHLRVDLELHFEEESIAKSKLNGVMKLLQNVEKDSEIIQKLFRKNFKEDGVVKEYFEYYTDEVGDISDIDFWSFLALKRIAFYPHDEDDYGVYDYGIDEISPYVLSLKINQRGAIVGCEMES